MFKNLLDKLIATQAWLFLAFVQKNGGITMNLNNEIESTKIYNYLEEETKDVIRYIKENLDLKTLIKLSNNDKDTLASMLVELLDSEDCITGSGSGSYSCSQLKAGRCLYGNWTLIEKAISTISPTSKITDCNPEKLDILIRVFLLEEAVDQALTTLIDKK